MESVQGSADVSIPIRRTSSMPSKLKATKIGVECSRIHMLLPSSLNMQHSHTIIASAALCARYITSGKQTQPVYVNKKHLRENDELYINT